MMTSWFQAFDNPVLIKEMRVGFREKKVFFALIAWVVIVALVASIATLVSFDSNQSLDRLPEAGQMFMEVLFWVQLVLLAMFSPSLTTSASMSISSTPFTVRALISQHNNSLILYTESTPKTIWLKFAVFA